MTKLLREIRRLSAQWVQIEPLASAPWCRSPGSACAVAHMRPRFESSSVERGYSWGVTTAAARVSSSYFIP